MALKLHDNLSFLNFEYDYIFLIFSNLLHLALLHLLQNQHLTQIYMQHILLLHLNRILDAIELTQPFVLIQIYQIHRTQSNIETIHYFHNNITCGFLHGLDYGK